MNYDEFINSYKVLLTYLLDNNEVNAAKYTNLNNFNCILSTLKRLSENDLKEREEETYSFENKISKKDASAEDKASINEDDIAKAASLRKDISALNDWIILFLNSNSKTKETEELFDNLKQVKDSIAPYYEELKARENALIQQDALNKGKDFVIPELKKKTIKELNDLSNIYKNVGIAHIKSKPSKFAGKPSALAELLGKVKHGLCTAVMTIASPISAIAMKINDIIQWKKHGSRPNRELAVAKLDEGRIPGTDGEHFEDLTRQVEDGKDDQPIIDDIRRIPLVYGKLIPEDPDQPPKITLKFNQRQIGSALAYDSKGGSGHAFLSIEYTKNNPVTGKPERYESTFGFQMKGGFGGMAHEAAELFTGSYVPGTITGEKGGDFNIGKSYTVNNKQINKLILAAQNYEKGGYNAVQRNCTTFAYDMAKAAGLTPDDFMYETDFDAEVGDKLKLFGKQIVGNFIVSRTSADHMYKKAQSEDYSYQKIGQNMVTKEDIKRLNKRTINVRMKGFSPSYVGEVLRAQSDAELLSSDIIKSWRQQLNQINMYTNNINNILLKDGTDSSGNIFRLNQYLNIRREMLLQMQDTLDDLEKKGEYQKTKECFFEQSKLIDDTVKGLNQIYHEGFMSRADLNIDFQLITAAFTSMKYNTKEQYIKFVSDWSKKSVYALPDEIRKNIEDVSRDTTLSIHKCLNETVNLAGVEGRPFTIAAHMLAFSVYKDVDNRALEKIQRTHVINELADAQMYFISKKIFTKDDYIFAFSKMPELVRNYKNKNSYNGMDVSTIYQAFAAEHVFGGLKGLLSVYDRNELRTHPEKITSIITNHIIPRILENPEEFEKLKAGIYDGVQKEFPKKAEESDLEYKSRINEAAFYKFTTFITNDYIKPVIQDLNLHGAYDILDLNLFGNAEFINALGDMKPVKAPDELSRESYYKRLLDPASSSTEEIENSIANIMVLSAQRQLGKSTPPIELSAINRQLLKNKMKSSGSIQEMLNMFSIDSFATAYTAGGKAIEEHENGLFNEFIMKNLDERTQTSLGLDKVSTISDNSDFYLDNYYNDSSNVAGNRPLTQDEYYKCFFGEDTKFNNPLNQKLAWNHVLGGVYEDIYKKLVVHPEKVNEIIIDAISTKLKENRNSFKSLHDAAAEYVMQKSLKDALLDDTTRTKMIESEVHNILIDSMKKSYLATYFDGEKNIRIDEIKLEKINVLRNSISSIQWMDEEVENKRNTLQNDFRIKVKNGSVGINDVKDFTNGVMALALMDKTRVNLSAEGNTTAVYSEERFSTIKDLLEKKNAHQIVLQNMSLRELAFAIKSEIASNHMLAFSSFVEDVLSNEEKRSYGLTPESAKGIEAKEEFTKKHLGQGNDSILFNKNHSAEDYIYAFKNVFDKPQKYNNGILLMTSDDSTNLANLLQEKLLTDLFDPVTQQLNNIDPSLGSEEKTAQAAKLIESQLIENHALFDVMLDAEIHQTKEKEILLKDKPFENLLDTTIKLNAANNLSHKICNFYLKKAFGNNMDEAAASKLLFTAVKNIGGIKQDMNSVLVKSREKGYQKLEKGIKADNYKTQCSSVEDILAAGIVERKYLLLSEDKRSTYNPQKDLENAKKFVSTFKLADKVLKETSGEKLFSKYKNCVPGVAISKTECQLLSNVVDATVEKIEARFPTIHGIDDVLSLISKIDSVDVISEFRIFQNDFEKLFPGVPKLQEMIEANDLRLYMLDKNALSNVTNDFLQQMIKNNKTAFKKLEAQVYNVASAMTAETGELELHKINADYACQHAIKQCLKEYCIKPAIDAARVSFMENDADKDGLKKLGVDNIDMDRKEINERLSHRSGIPQRYIDQRNALYRDVLKLKQLGIAGLYSDPKTVSKLCALSYIIEDFAIKRANSKKPVSFPSDEYIQKFQENTNERLVANDFIPAFVGLDIGNNEIERFSPDKHCIISDVSKVIKNTGLENQFKLTAEATEKNIKNVAKAVAPSVIH